VPAFVPNVISTDTFSKPSIIVQPNAKKLSRPAIESKESLFPAHGQTKFFFQLKAKSVSDLSQNRTLHQREKPEFLQTKAVK